MVLCRRSTPLRRKAVFGREEQSIAHTCDPYTLCPPQPFHRDQVGTGPSLPLEGAENIDGLHQPVPQERSAQPRFRV